MGYVQRNCLKCKTIFYGDKCFTCYKDDEEIQKPIWDWKLNYPLCKICGKDSTQDYYKDLTIGYRFCKECYQSYRDKISLVLYDLINPNRIISNECNNKEWHKNNICEFGIDGECLCKECGLRLSFCDCPHK